MDLNYAMTEDLAEEVTISARRLLNLIDNEKVPGENAFEVALAYDMLDSELRHLKDRYDVHYQNSMEEAMPGPPPLLQRSDNG